MHNKLLIIRFSSFGDIVQTMSAATTFKSNYPDSHITFFTKKEFGELVSANRAIDEVVLLDKKTGIQGLLKLALFLKKQNFSIVYDAHVNHRTRIIKPFLSGNRIFIKRSKERFKRILLFKFRIDRFNLPFRGALSFIKPLNDVVSCNLKRVDQQWHFSNGVSSKVETLLKSENISEFNFIVLAPSAAWPMKRWPIEHWKQVIDQTSSTFIIVGGPGDTFLSELEISPERVFNFAGKLSLLESCYLVTKSQRLISGDTGILHVADALGIPATALIGPTAFGHTSGEQVTTLEIDMNCRPCTKDGRGGCSDDIYQKCLVSITPEMVIETINTVNSSH